MRSKRGPGGLPGALFNFTAIEVMSISGHKHSKGKGKNLYGT